MMKHKKVLANIISLLKERGASAVVLANIADIVVDERVRLKCRVPVCDSYNKNLMCPPYVPSVAEFREALKNYKQAILLQVSAELNETCTMLLRKRFSFLPENFMNWLIWVRGRPLPRGIVLPRGLSEAAAACVTSV